MEVLKDRIYKNVAGFLVYVISVGTFGGCEEEMVVYRRIDREAKLFAMPKEEFCEELGGTDKSTCGQKYRFQLEELNKKYEKRTTEMIEKVKTRCDGQDFAMQFATYVKDETVSPKEKGMGK